MQKTIIQRFNSFKSDNLGSIPTLSRAVRGMKFGRQKVIDAFNKLVPLEEYAKNEKDGILNDLLARNFSDETVQKVIKNQSIQNKD